LNSDLSATVAVKLEVFARPKRPPNREKKKVASRNNSAGLLQRGGNEKFDAGQDLHNLGTEGRRGGKGGDREQESIVNPRGSASFGDDKGGARLKRINQGGNLEQTGGDWVVPKHSQEGSD